MDFGSLSKFCRGISLVAITLIDSVCRKTTRCSSGPPGSGSLDNGLIHSRRFNYLGATLSQALTPRLWSTVITIGSAVCALVMSAAQVWAAEKKPSSVVVRAVPVAVMDFHDRVEALGTLRAKESVALTATVTDIVSAIHFDDGQRVVKGQVLVEMSAAEERALLAEIQSMVAEAKLQYERTKGLAKRRLTAETVLDERRRLYETSKARLLAMKARMSDRTIRAPFSGIVGLRNISVGALVEPGTVIVKRSNSSREHLLHEYAAAAVVTNHTVALRPFLRPYLARKLDLVAFVTAPLRTVGHAAAPALRPVLPGP